MDRYRIDPAIKEKKDLEEGKFNHLLGMGSIKNCDTIQSARNAKGIPSFVDFRITIRDGGIVWYWVNEKAWNESKAERKIMKRKSFFRFFTIALLASLTTGTIFATLTLAANKAMDTNINITFSFSTTAIFAMLLVIKLWRQGFRF